MSEPQDLPKVNETSAEQTKSVLPADRTRDFKPGAAPERSAANVQVPGYRLLGVLGRGGMGVVYKAVQEKADRLVALKMILAGAHADQHDRTRFHVEASAAARMSHPNIVQLYEVGETPDGFPFFSLEFVSGGTLSDRLKQGPLRPSEAAALVEALARAMQYAHERGIVHRDLKPLNILLEGARNQESGVRGQGSIDDKKETMVKDLGARTINRPDLATARSGASMTYVAHALVPKISDFGLAKQLDAEDGLTRTGAVMGSPSYMAPEQAFGQSKNVGPAADIYALGAILYECLTGRPPFKGASVADTLEQVRTMEPITLKAFVKEIPRDLETICLHCLHKEPHKRYASAEALADDLRRYQEQKPISVRPVSNLERALRWCKRNPGWAAMIGLVAISLVTATGVSSAAYVFAENERKDAVEARDDAKKKEKEAREARALAEARGEQSLKAVGLFATDARQYCEDAMVPGESRKRLYGVLIDQLEKQADQAAGEATIDALRNKTFMYQTLCAVTHDFRQFGESERWYQKGIASVDEWDKEQPGHPVPRTFRATLLDLHGRNLKKMDKLDLAKEVFARSLEIREQLAGNLDMILPAKVEAITKLADSLDSVDRYEDSIKLRTKVLKLYEEEEKKCVQDQSVAADAKEREQAERRYREARLRSFSYRDALCQTYTNAGLFAIEYPKRKEYLASAYKLSNELHNDRKASRNVLVRQALVAKMLGELEYSHGKLAEKEKKPDEAAMHFESASEIYTKLPEITTKLATSNELLDGLREYSRSFYLAGLAHKRNKEVGKARMEFQRSWDIRKQVLEDYRGHHMDSHLELDLYFSQLALGEYKETMKTLSDVKTVFLAVEPATAYRVACLYALAVESMAEASGGKLTGPDKITQGRHRQEAIRFLRSAHDRGFTDFFQSNIDADLDSIRDDPAMKEFEATHHYLLGVQEKKRHDAKKAQAQFKKAQEFAQGYLNELPRDKRHAQVKGVWLCAHVQLGNYADAIQIADQMSPKLDSNRPALFRLARVYALASAAAKDEKLKKECLDKAFRALEQAADGNLKETLESEEDLDPLRGDPRYQEIKRVYEKAPRSLFW